MKKKQKIRNQIKNKILDVNFAKNNLLLNNNRELSLYHQMSREWKQGS